MKTHALVIAALPALLLASPQTARAQQAGEVLWAVNVGFNYNLPPPTVAPDGTIYINSEDLYAISPNGQVLWTAEHFGAHVVGLGDDGTVYASNGADVSAYGPNGNLLWTFVEDPRGGGFMAGPTVGPDGNVYAISDTLSGGLGAFSLTPDGHLRWSVSGFEDHQPFGFVSRTVPFAQDRLYWAFDRVPGCGSTGLVSLLLANGAVDWCVETGSYSRPAVGTDGMVFLGGLDLSAFDAAGNLLWTANVLGPGAPATGPDGAVFVLGHSYDLFAFESDGTPRWSFANAAEGNFPINPPAVAPNGSAVVFGTSYSFGHTGEIRAHDPATGARLWTVSLTGPSEGVSGPPTFSPDGSVVYVPTSTFSTSSLVAVRVSDAGGSDCGNAICESTENALTCPSDCFDLCGDGLCSVDEDPLSCSEDCPDQCGDGLCSGVENTANCWADCGFCGDDVCDPSENQTTCAPDCAPVCGDSVVEGDEECEAGVPLADTCQSLGFDEGALSCNGSTCDYDTSDCADNACLPRRSRCSNDSECCSGSCRGWWSRRCR
jgi:outer membrane protein assembly factor BamB